MGLPGLRRVAAVAAGGAGSAGELMRWSDSEQAWLERRARKISEERGWPMPIATSEAARQLVHARATREPAVVLKFRSPRVPR